MNVHLPGTFPKLYVIIIINEYISLYNRNMWLDCWCVYVGLAVQFLTVFVRVVVFSLLHCQLICKTNGSDISLKCIVNNVSSFIEGKTWLNRIELICNCDHEHMTIYWTAHWIWSVNNWSMVINQSKMQHFRENSRNTPKKMHMCTWDNIKCLN